MEKQIKELRETLKYKKEHKIRIIKELKELSINQQLIDYIMIKYDIKDLNISQLLYEVLTDGTNSTCVCGRKKQFYRYSSGYHKTCGKKECIDISRNKNYKKTIKNKYGVNHATQLKTTRDKQKQTMLKKYGVDHNSKGELRQNYTNTMLKKYGVDSPLKNKEILEKRNNTVLSKFGTLDFIQSNKTKETNLQKYGFENAAKNEKIKEKIKESNTKTSIKIAAKKLQKHDIEIIKYYSDSQKYELLCKKCGNSLSLPGCSVNTRLRQNESPCLICNPYVPDKSSSNLEKEIIAFIKEISNIPILTNYKQAIKNIEFDIYFPTKKIAIEVNGVYWHSEIFKEKKYHFTKSQLAINNEIKVYQIWEDDWNLNKELIKNMISIWLNHDITTIYARNCNIKIINNKTAIDFCNTNHLKRGKSSTIQIGLFNKTELIGVMTFLKIKNIWHLDRLCFKQKTKVIGGASKLLKFFIRNYSPNKILTKADVDLSPDKNNNVYQKLGFKNIGWTQSYSWVINGIRENRRKFTKKKLVKLGYSTKLSESEIMSNLKYYRTFESGNWSYCLNSTNL